MPDHPSPVAAELAEGRDLSLLPDAEQLALIQEERPDLDARGVVDLARKRGRPKGAINRRNAKFREQLLGMCNGVHPALVLARAATTPVEMLAAQLECSKLEAAQFAQRSAVELLPYIESKQPVDVNLTKRNDVVLIMPGGGVSEEQIEAMRAEIGDAEIDWGSAEFGDLIEAVPSLSGGRQGDVASEQGS